MSGRPLFDLRWLIPRWWKCRNPPKIGGFIDVLVAGPSLRSKIGQQAGLVHTRTTPLFYYEFLTEFHPRDQLASLAGPSRRASLDFFWS